GHARLPELLEVQVPLGLVEEQRARAHEMHRHHVLERFGKVEDVAGSEHVQDRRGVDGAVDSDRRIRAGVYQRLLQHLDVVGRVVDVVVGGGVEPVVGSTQEEELAVVPQVPVVGRNLDVDTRVLEERRDLGVVVQVDANPVYLRKEAFDSSLQHAGASPERGDAHEDIRVRSPSHALEPVSRNTSVRLSTVTGVDRAHVSTACTVPRNARPGGGGMATTRSALTSGSASNGGDSSTDGPMTRVLQRIAVSLARNATLPPLHTLR